MYSTLLILGEGTSGIGSLITALTSGLTASAFWDVIVPMAPFIIAMVLFAFGWGFIRKTLRKAQKGKGA